MSRKGVRRQAADPLPRKSPGGQPTKHPEAGRRPVALMEETHRAKQMEGNTRSETSVPWAISSSYSRAGCAPGRQLHPREPSIVFWRRSGGSSGPAARPTSLAREATRFRGPPSVPLPSGRRRLLTGALSSWSSSFALATAASERTPPFMGKRHSACWWPALGQFVPSGRLHRATRRVPPRAPGS
jgi:hypothetical protein